MFTVLVFRALDFSTMDYGMILRIQVFTVAISKAKHFSQDTSRVFKPTKSISDQSNVVVKRWSGLKRYYPPPFKSLPRIAAARILRDNPPWKINTRAARARLRAG